MIKENIFFRVRSIDLGIHQAVSIEADKTVNIVIENALLFKRDSRNGITCLCFEERNWIRKGKNDL
jgi:hypothetical protein